MHRLPDLTTEPRWRMCLLAMSAMSALSRAGYDRPSICAGRGLHGDPLGVVGSAGYIWTAAKLLPFPAKTLHSGMFFLRRLLWQYGE